MAKLGLTKREAEKFIVYWLPKSESNKYNYIRFATIDVEEQQIKTPERNGFVVVEWGKTEIKQ